MLVAVHYPHSQGSVMHHLRTFCEHKKLTCDPLALLPKRYPRIPYASATVPPAYRYPLQHFWLLHKRRNEGFNGPLRISYTAIQYYSDLTGNWFSSWELETLLALDEAWFGQVTEERKQQDKTP